MSGYCVRTHKHNARKCIIDGVKFPSLRQGARYRELKLLVKAKAITDLRLEVPHILAPSVIINGRKKPALRYYADFVYLEDGQKIVEDCKGMKTQVYIIKRHLMKSVHGIDIRES